MKSTRVYIKANYIKKAKVDWIYCDAQIIKQNQNSMLKLSSINPTNDDKEDAQSRVSNFSNVSTIIPSKSSQSVSLKVLCNLSEFKSREIKPVNFYNEEKFSIRLVPVGILNSKKLFFVPEFEEDLSKWFSLLGEHIHRQKEGENKIQKSFDLTESETMKRRERESLGKDEYSTIKSKRDMDNKMIENGNGEASTMRRKQDTMTASKHSDDKESVSANSPSSSNSGKLDEIYFAMDDNDVYEGSCADNIYTVCIEETHDSQKIGIRGSYLMKIKSESIELCDLRKGETIHEFPYIFIRRFGAKKDLLRLEAGRKCSTGEGYFVFRFKDAGKAVLNIRQVLKELKQSSNRASQITDSEDCLSNRNSVVVSPNSASFECNFDTNDCKTKPSVSPQPSVSSISSPPISQSTHSLSFAVNNSLSSSPPVNPPIAKKPLHPLYNSINSIPNGCRSTNASTGSNGQISHSLSPSRLPVINTSFNRNQYASSFTYRRPSQVTIPVIKDDSCQKSAIYDNIPPYEQVSLQNMSPARPNSNNSSVKFTSSYNLQSPLANTARGQYDNVPNNQRCIKELESMLMDLGIATN